VQFIESDVLIYLSCVSLCFARLFCSGTQRTYTHLSQWMLEAWLLLLLRLCSVTRLSSSSSSMRKGCDEVGSSFGHEYCWRNVWDSAALAVSRSMGLKVKIRSRKSTAEKRRKRDE